MEQKNYKWYDQASAGTLLTTGTSYADVFASSTTVYVEEAATGVNNYTTDVATVPDGKYHAWAGTEWTLRCAQLFVVETDLKIKSLRLLASKLNGITFNVKIINAANAPNFSDVAEYGPFTSPAEAGSQSFEANLFDFDINADLAPGTYLIYVEPTTGDEGNYGFVNGYTQESSEAGVYTLKKAMFQATDLSDTYPNFNVDDVGSAYGPFLNWKIETGANASCGRTAATATVVACGPPDVTIVKPTDAGAYYTQSPLIDFEATITDGGSVTSVVFEVWKDLTKVATLNTNSSGTTYTATWQADAPGTDYQFKVIATDNDAEEKEAYGDFTVMLDVSAAQDVIVNGNLGVYPNPTTDEFNVTFDLISANNVNIEVVNTVGAVVYSKDMGSLTGTQLLNVKADLGAGLYFVNVKVGNETITTPLNVVK